MLRAGTKKIWTSAPLRDMQDGRWAQRPSALLTAVKGYSAEVLADTPKLFWKLQDASGNPVDSSGGGFNADTSFGTVSYQARTGPFSTDYGLRLGSGTAKGGFSRSVSVSTVNNPWSIEIWVYPVTMPGSLDSVLCGNSNRANDNTGGGTGGYEMATPSTGSKLHLGLPNVGDEPDMTNSLALNAWNHVVMTKASGSGGTVKYYFNGASDNASVTIDNPAAGSGTRTMKVGCNFGSNYDLYVAYFAVYEIELSSSRVSAHYNAGAP